jgi:hypothetical protein
MFVNHITVIVPSKTKDGVHLNHQQYINKVLRDLTKMFGGATATGIFLGAYKMESGKIMTENVAQITSFTNSNDFKKLIIYLAKLKKVMNQESIAYIINNVMYFL